MASDELAGDGAAPEPAGGQGAETVTEAIQLLRSRGYTSNYDLVDGVLRDDAATTCAIEDAQVEVLYRFEGPSDPGDQMIVFGVHDPASGTRGTLAAAFGLNADPELYEHLSDLRARHR